MNPRMIPVISPQEHLRTGHHCCLGTQKVARSLTPVSFPLGVPVCPTSAPVRTTIDAGMTWLQYSQRVPGRRALRGWHVARTRSRFTRALDAPAPTRCAALAAPARQPGPRQGSRELAQLPCSAARGQCEPLSTSAGPLEKNPPKSVILLSTGRNALAPAAANTIASSSPVGPWRVSRAARLGVRGTSPRRVDAAAPAR